MTPEEKPYYTPQEIATALDITLRTVYNWLRSGRLKGTLITSWEEAAKVRVRPGHWAVSEADFQQFLKGNGTIIEPKDPDEAPS